MSAALAQRLFASRLAHEIVEADLSKALDTLYGDFHDFTYDYYDESVEVYGVVPSAEAYDKLRELGFVRIWQHPHPNGEDTIIRDCGCKAVRP